MEFNVFISHASEGKTAADAVCAVFEGLGPTANLAVTQNTPLIVPYGMI